MTDVSVFVCLSVVKQAMPIAYLFYCAQRVQHYVQPWNSRY